VTDTDNADRNTHLYGQQHRTDTDTPTVTDTDTPTATRTIRPTDTDTPTVTDTDTPTERVPILLAYANGHGYPDGDGYRHADRNADIHSEQHANGYRYPDGDGHGYANGDPHLYGQ
jgi:hypothetical protein